MRFKHLMWLYMRNIYLQKIYLVMNTYNISPLHVIAWGLRSIFGLYFLNKSYIMILEYTLIVIYIGFSKIKDLPIYNF
jgi:hypothetical protein